jgi:predicted nucleic acid-binding Zn finger protein
MSHRAKILELYDGGRTVSQIAQYLGISREYVRVELKLSNDRKCSCGSELGPLNRTGRCRSCSAVVAIGGRPIPDDFHIIAATRTNAEVRAYYGGIGNNTLARWRKATNTPAPKERPSRMIPVPEGFAEIAPQITLKEARLRFGRCADTIRGWCAATGVSLRKASLFNTNRSARQFQPGAPAIVRDDSRPGRAADYLRRFGEVIRCDANGKPQPKGKFWRRGGRFVLTDEEIIQRAIRNGWRPDAWKEVA